MKQNRLFSPPPSLDGALSPLPGAHSGRDAALADTERREEDAAAAGAATVAERRVAAIVSSFFFRFKDNGVESDEGRERRE